MVVNDRTYFSKINRYELQECINNFEVIYKDKLDVKEDICFGLEIEFDGVKYEDFKKIYNSSGWKLKVEGTVPYGAEISSPPLSNNKENWNELKKICNFIKDNRGYIDELCGGHIHIASQVLGSNLNHWINFLKLWTIYEPIIYSFLLGEENYLRAGILTNAKPIGKDMCNFLNNSFENTLDFINRLPNKTKKYGINFSNVSDLENQKEKNTIEFRSPNGSLNEIVWQNNVNLIVKMIMYAKSKNFDSELIDYKFNLLENTNFSFKYYYEVNIEKALEFVDLIFMNNSDKITFLRQYINKNLKEKVKII